ncbi:L-aspartate oxidase [Heyndrickxia acidicola]|uniref:L-aspartate oxidase n=1 Tax=Heyndrickxia acidicola TaxID=209389 RepID=A0ABU6MJX4_9BACI|nr:L-aspartate oxidase [Heyndrickxia acidicola]MED1204774.1 L-aspartate oxidase [Heyndrickxia acidicola]
MIKCDILIIGSGIAAMQLARNLSADLHVIIITKGKWQNSNSFMAQGGVAAAVSSDDSWELHFKDTIEAGENFHNDSEVMKLVQIAPEMIKNLQNTGVRFDCYKNGNLSLGKEGAHSRNRILHCGGDATGKHIMEQFHLNLPQNVELIEGQFVYELLLDQNKNRCIGVKTRDRKGEKHIYRAGGTVLAAGGIGGLYPFTSNDHTIAGDGLALAYKAGVKITDAEFIQFHPTLLYVNGCTHGLISEAVRGEGAILVNDQGEPIMQGVHPLKDLAPRHIVAEQIFKERLAGRDVFLDISMIADFPDKFPTITDSCLKNGIDIEAGKIPVAPGSHFFMGGIKIDPHGRSSLEGLYSIGESACSGVHGANRLASNSLLEGLVYGKRLAEYLNHNRKECESAHKLSPISYQDIVIPVLPEKAVIQQKMMENAGIIREGRKLKTFIQWIESYGVLEIIKSDLDALPIQQIETIFMLISAHIIAVSSLSREESRGGHIRADFPNSRKEWESRHIINSIHGMEIGGENNESYQIEIHA